jgi:hypothetical protein
LGFEGPFSGKKHEYMRKGNIRIIIPNPHGQDIGPVLIRASSNTQVSALKNG